MWNFPMPLCWLSVQHLDQNSCLDKSVKIHQLLQFYNEIQGKGNKTEFQDSVVIALTN